MLHQRRGNIERVKGNKRAQQRQHRGPLAASSATSNVARAHLVVALRAAELARRAELELARHGLVRHPPTRV